MPRTSVATPAPGDRVRTRARPGQCQCSVSLAQCRPLTSGAARGQCAAPGPVARSMTEAAPEQQQQQRQQQPQQLATRVYILFYTGMKSN